VRLDHEVDDTGTAELWPVYDAVFGDQPDLATWRATVWDRHMARDGFRLARTYDRQGLAGFAYGYTGEHGQWWTDQVAGRAPAHVVEEWVGGHLELVELAVDPGCQGRGYGTALHDAVLLGTGHDRALLTTWAGDRPASRLYPRLGWTLLHPRVFDDSDLWGLDLRSRSH
jgi:ribosomal protein S18 acetylase RimI-like enzyme